MQSRGGVGAHQEATTGVQGVCLMGEEGVVGFEEVLAAGDLEFAGGVEAEGQEGVDEVFEGVAGVEEGPVDEGADLAVGI